MWSGVRNGVAAGEARRPALVARTVAIAVLLLLVLPALVTLSKTRDRRLPSRTELESMVAAVVDRQSRAMHPGLKAAAAQGLVQGIRPESTASALQNIIAHATKATAEGMTTAYIRAAAVHAVRTHILAEKRPTPSLLRDQLKEAVEEAAARETAAADSELNIMTNLADANPQKVLVKMYLEADCPTCSRFTREYMHYLLNESSPAYIGNIVDFEYLAWGTGKVEKEKNGLVEADDVLNKTIELKPVLHEMEEYGDVAPVSFVCKHGMEECMANAWEACIQDVAPKHEDSFGVFECIERRFCDSSAKSDCLPEAGLTASLCSQQHGTQINSTKVIACFQSTRVKELMVMNDISTLHADVKWLPWLTVDGSSLLANTQSLRATNSNISATDPSFREQFFLGKTVCDAYVKKTGLEYPEACYVFPQNDAELGSDPWTFFETTNLTSIVAKHKEQLLQEVQQEKIQEETAVNSNWWAAVAMVVVGVCVMGGAGYFLHKTKGVPTPEHTTFADREKSEKKGLLSASNNA